MREQRAQRGGRALFSNTPLHHDDTLHIDVAMMDQMNFVLEVMAFDIAQIEPARGKP